MSRQTKRDLKKEILDTATRLVYTQGYRAGVDQIIAEAGVAKMTYYKYFPAKSELLSAVIERVHQRIDLRMREIAADGKQSALAQAEQTLEFLFSSMTDSAFLGTLIPQALLEIHDEKNGARQMALACTKRILDSIGGVCLKAGIRCEMIVL